MKEMLKVIGQGRYYLNAVLVGHILENCYRSSQL